MFFTIPCTFIGHEPFSTRGDTVLFNGVIPNVHVSMWEKFDSILLLIVKKLLRISIKLSVKLIFIQFAETSVRKVETLYAQNMIIIYLHCNTVHFVGELVAVS